MSERRFLPAEVVAQSDLGGGYRLLTLEAPHLAAGEVGSFALISVRPSGSPATDPILPRPFSFLSRDREQGRVEIFYRVVGRGTAQMANFSPGTRLDTLGPLGQGFQPPRSERVVLLAGGVGMPPMLDLAGELASGHPVTCYYGGRSASDLHFLDRFEAVGVELVACTDDGSAGVSGTNIAAFQTQLDALGGAELSVYACGPTPMLRAAGQLAAERGFSLELSLEANMACGIGVCRGCAVARSDGSGYAMICQDGPVFPSSEVRP